MGGAEGTRNRFDQPVDVAVAPDGTVYVVDLRGRIARLDAAGNVATEWPVEIGTARGGSHLAVWQDHVVMTDPDRNRLVVLTPASGEVRYVGGAGTEPGQFRLPIGVAAGPDGKLYVVDSDNARVQVFNTLDLK
jgi:DNA-binding beta-propeller fold protein YncE